MQCRPKPLQSTFCLKTFDYPHTLDGVSVIDFFGDQQRLRSRKNKPLVAARQCKALQDDSRIHTEHTWQTPAVLQVPHHQVSHHIELCHTPRMNNTAKSWQLGQHQASDSTTVVVVALMLAVAVVICRLPRKLGTISKASSNGQIEVSAVAQ